MAGAQAVQMPIRFKFPLILQFPRPAPQFRAGGGGEKRDIVALGAEISGESSVRAIGFPREGEFERRGCLGEGFAGGRRGAADEEAGFAQGLYGKVAVDETRFGEVFGFREKAGEFGFGLAEVLAGVAPARGEEGRAAQPFEEPPEGDGAGFGGA